MSTQTSISNTIIEALKPLDELIIEMAKLAEDLENVYVAQTNRLALLVSTEIYRLADIEMKVGALCSAYHQDAKELDRQLKELTKAKADDAVMRASLATLLRQADECSEWRKCLETKKSAAKEAIMVLKKITDSKREGVC